MKNKWKKGKKGKKYLPTTANTHTRYPQCTAIACSKQNQIETISVDELVPDTGRRNADLTVPVRSIGQGIS